MSSTSVSIPENSKDFLCCFISLLHCVSGVTEVEEVRSSAPQIAPTKLKNEQDITARYVSDSTRINSGFRCNVTEKWISRFVYLENDAIFAFDLEHLVPIGYRGCKASHPV